MCLQRVLMGHFVKLLYAVSFGENCCMLCHFLIWRIPPVSYSLMTSDASDKVLDCLDMLTNTKSRVRSDVGWLGMTLVGVWKKCFYLCNKCFYLCNKRVYFIKPYVSVCELVRERHVQYLDPSQLSSNTHITLITCSTHSVGVRSGGKSLGVSRGTFSRGPEWFWVVTQNTALFSMMTESDPYGNQSEGIWVIYWSYMSHMLYGIPTWCI